MTDGKEIETEDNSRQRGVWFGIFCLLCLLAMGAYIGFRWKRSPSAPAAPISSSAFVPSSALIALRDIPHLLFRSAASGDAFGQVAMTPLLANGAPKAATPFICDRVHFAHGRGICLRDNRKNIHPPGIATLFDAELRTLYTFSLAGAPSRARVSSDGRYAAATVFVTGDNYATAFSTRTSIIDVESGKILDDLEQFSVTKDDQPFREIDMNFWGVTFAKDSDHFYATVASGGKTYLIEGSITGRKAHVLKENVECPSLSPDETRIAYKMRVSRENGWRLHVVDLKTMADLPIEGETRSIDDQVEWLDDDHVLYGFVDARGLPEEAMNVWMSPTPKQGAGATDPLLFIHGASSPVVVR